MSCSLTFFQIKELKATRGQYKEMKHIFDDKRARYENFKAKLAKDRRDLEHDHDQHQKQWQQMERDYHHLFSLNEILKVNIKQIEDEDEECRSRNALPRNNDSNFLRDLYERQLTLDGNLEKTLRIDQRKIKDVESDSLKQVRFEIYPLSASKSTR
jgi:hypothetical protein